MPGYLNFMNNGTKTPSLRDFRFRAIIQATKTTCLQHFAGKAVGQLRETLLRHSGMNNEIT